MLDKFIADFNKEGTHANAKANKKSFKSVGLRGLFR